MADNTQDTPTEKFTMPSTQPGSTQPMPNMQPSPTQPMPPVQRIFVAPDGSRIATSTMPGGAPNYAGPYAAPTNQYGPGMAAPQAPYSAMPQARYGTATVPEEGPQTMNVGLLVWGAILAIVGLILVFTSIFGGNTFQAIVVILFAAAGIGFLILAYLTSQNRGPVAASARQGQPGSEQN